LLQDTKDPVSSLCTEHPLKSRNTTEETYAKMNCEHLDVGVRDAPAVRTTDTSRHNSSKLRPRATSNYDYDVDDVDDYVDNCDDDGDGCLTRMLQQRYSRGVVSITIGNA